MTDFNRTGPIIPRTRADILMPCVSERLINRPLLMPALILFAACYMTFLAGNLIPLCLSALIILSACVFSLKKHQTNLFLCSLTSLILIAFSCLRMNAVLNAAVPESTEDVFIGTVISCERKLAGTNRIIIETEGVRAELKLDEETDPSKIKAGQTLKITGRFKEPVKPGNPGEFDYPGYLRSKGIRYLFYADSYRIIEEPDGIKGLMLSFPEFCFNCRKYLFDRFTNGRSKEEKALLAAVCLGDSSLADDEVTRDFSLSGCSHLLAVSGTHFAGFLAVLPYVLNSLLPDRRKGSLIYMFFAFLIACLTGWSESVTRSAFMSSSAFAGKDTVSAMAAAALVMMAADPFCSSRTGFLLSFSACISIRLLSGRIDKSLKYLKDKKALRSALSAQTAAILGTLPFTGLIQTRLSAVQFVVQALGGVLAKAVCMMFFPGAAFSLLLPVNCSSVFSMPSAFFLNLLRNLVKTGASLILKTAGGKPLEPFFVMCVWMFVCLMLLPTFSVRKTLLKVSCALLSISLGLTLSGAVRPLRAQIVFADVGQGDCCLIMTGNQTVLIDSGTFEKGDKQVSDLLDHYGISRIDMAFMTHWDQDHSGGLAALDNKGRITEIYTGFTGTDPDTEAFDKSLRSRNCDPVSFRRILKKTEAGDVFELSDDVRLKVIYPKECTTGGNPGSLVILLECCGKSFLFTGDIGSETEELLIEQDLLQDIDILKVSHHGSKYSSTDGFLAKTSPEVSVISVGRNNLYGHPSPKVLERLDYAGSTVYRTDEDGAVIFEFY